MTGITNSKHAVLSVNVKDVCGKFYIDKEEEKTVGEN